MNWLFRYFSFVTKYHHVQMMKCVECIHLFWVNPFSHVSGNFSNSE